MEKKEEKNEDKKDGRYLRRDSLIASSNKPWFCLTM